jgi:hypothetical protein
MTQIVFQGNASRDGGFEASAIGHHIFTQGDTFEELASSVLDAVRCHFKSDPLPAIYLIFTRVDCGLEAAEDDARD